MVEVRSILLLPLVARCLETIDVLLFPPSATFVVQLDIESPTWQHILDNST